MNFICITGEFLEDLKKVEKNDPTEYFEDILSFISPKDKRAIEDFEEILSFISPKKVEDSV